MKQDKILVIDFGGQYNQIITKRVRELGVSSEVYPNTITKKEIKKYNPKGIIFTGGPNNVYAQNSPKISKDVFELDIPILGICYGSQLMAHLLGGKVSSAKISEYGKTKLSITCESELFDSIPSNLDCYMSHTDYISDVPKGFIVTSSTKDCPIASMENQNKKLYAVQFHPEVDNSYGKKLIENFIFNICKCECNNSYKTLTEDIVARIKSQIKDSKVICGLSGGLDSSVTALLLSKAIKDNLTCVFIDHGLYRDENVERIDRIFGKNGLFNINIIKINAKDRFLNKLKGVYDPEQKRKIVGTEFLRIFEEVAEVIKDVDYLAQGTIYTDVVESGYGPSARIKSHHNVGALPENTTFKSIYEPLRMLLKEDVRKIAEELGLPNEILNSQPFTGPGFGIRIIGEVTEEKLDIVKKADAIFVEEIEKAGLNKQLGQYFAALTNMQTVGVMGDERTYDYAVVLRAVTTNDYMTAEWARLPYDFVDLVSKRIVNEVKGVNRILVDCTSKPPATIEFE